MGIAFFDLDRTLLDCNSARLWLSHEWREGEVSFKTGLWASYWLIRYSLGSGNIEHAIKAAVAHLEGQEESVFAERVKKWFEADVRHRLRPGAAKAIARHRQEEDAVILATSSSTYVAELARQAYVLDGAICTRFEVENGHFTGRVASSAIGEAKAHQAQTWAAERGESLSDAYFYTDSISDLALMEMVGHPVAVNPDRALLKLARSRSWPVIDWGTANGEP